MIVVTYIMRVLSPAIVRRAAVCIGSYFIQKTTPADGYKSGTSVRGSYINLQALQKLAERIQKKKQLS